MRFPLVAACAMPLDGVDLAEVAERTGGFTGADLKALCQQAAVLAMVRG
jgi:SpoVK/Ycf46/Vps4 family AAA+-type ATPase